MHTAIVTLKSVSPYSQSRFHNTPKSDKETHQDHEARTWRERLHANEDGYVYIPPMSLKNALSEAAKYLSMQIPGKGKSTFTKHIEAGTLCIDPLVLACRKEEVAGEWLFVPASGKRGDGKRVLKCFPVIPSWSGKASFTILDDLVTREVFVKHLEEAGRFIGIGRFRPRNNGFYGRFSVEKVEWS